MAPRERPPYSSQISYSPMSPAATKRLYETSTPAGAPARRESPERKAARARQALLSKPAPAPAEAASEEALVCGNAIERAYALHVEYVRRRDEFVEWASDEIRMGWQLIAQWTRTLLEQDGKKYARRIDEDRLSHWEELHVHEATWLRDAYEEKGRELVELLQSAEFATELKALDEEEQDDVYADLVSVLSESQAGRAFVTAELDSPDSHLTTAIFKSGRKASSAFWKTLEAVSPCIVVRHRYEAIEIVTEIITSRIDIVQTNLTGPMDFFPAGSPAALKKQVRVVGFREERILLKDLGKKAADRANQALDGFNLAVAIMATYENSSDVGSYVSLTGATASFLDKFEKTKKALSFTYVARSAGVTVAARAAVREVRVPVLSIVSGLCEIVMGSARAYDRFAKGDSNAAGFHVVNVVGAIASVAGALIYAGVWTAWAPGVGLTLIAVGAALGFIATVGVALFEDDPVEQWMIQNFFGTDYGKYEAYAHWRTNHRAQLDALHRIYSAVEYEKVVFKPHHYAFKIRPALLLESSSAWLTVEYRWRSHHKVVQDRRRIEPGGHGVKTAGGRILEIDVWLDTPMTLYEEARAMGEDELLFDAVTLRLEVDLYSDGKTLVHDTRETFNWSFKDTVLKWL